MNHPYFRNNSLTFTLTFHNIILQMMPLQTLRPHTQPGNTYIFSNHKVYLSYLFDWITVDWMIRIDEHP